MPFSPLAAGLRAAGPLLLFAPTIFVSAWLLFQVQPMFAKMALPLLGGSPVVWNTALVFFQTALFLGYLYAHALGSRVGLVWQVAIHLCVLAIAFLALPVAIADSWRNPPAEAPISWLIALLTMSVGLPFFAISANAPLLQNWFARTGHATAHDPYFLYAASNLGSILALLAYPFLLEPSLRLADQSQLWTGGFAVLTALIAACAIYVLRRKQAARANDVAAADATPAITWKRRLRWLALAFVPSGLLVAATSYMTTDLAAIPLLWIVPLTLYLLSFVFVFARTPLMTGRWSARVQAGLVCAAAIISTGALAGYVAVGIVLATLFATSLICHGELVRQRPAASGLTEFYVWMSLGGILGSAFCALLAPLVFDRVLEYAILLVMAAFLRPSPKRGAAAPDRPLPALLPAVSLRETSVPVACAIAAGLLAWYDGSGTVAVGATVVLGVFVAVVAVGAMNRPVMFGLCVAVLAGIGLTLTAKSQEAATLHRERSYFGTHRVLAQEQGRFVALVHGNTIHGVEATAPERRREPLGYFHVESGVGRIFAALDATGRTPRNVAVVGLGSGVLACYRKPGQAWTFFEIDAAVLRIARDPRFFHFLSDCAPDAPVVLGDGRLMLLREEAAKFDVLIVDVFSSDSIPLHLYTREALRLYLDRLAPGGVVMFHVSNRYLNLEPALAALMRDLGTRARILRSFSAEVPAKSMRWGSVWIAMTPHESTLKALTDDFDGAQPSTWGKWRPLTERPGLRAWTDDYSNLLDIIE